MSAGKMIRTSLLVLICALFLLHSIYLPRQPLIDTLENASYDLRLRMTLPGGIDDRIIIADIDEKSLGVLGHWPWDRGTLADMMDSLFGHYQIHSLGFDVLFAEPDTDPGVTALRQLASDELRRDRNFQRIWQRLGPQLDFDQRFANSFQDRRVVLGYVFQNTEE
ncbi:MAG: adenylate/guanylate cyclase domain-containing protein, partial [Gammaproteobacteria bacterium HGW-Gammaproteobacteria-14]